MFWNIKTTAVELYFTCDIRQKRNWQNLCNIAGEITFNYMIFPHIFWIYSWTPLQRTWHIAYTSVLYTIRKTPTSVYIFLYNNIIYRVLCYCIQRKISFLYYVLLIVWKLCFQHQSQFQMFLYLNHFISKNLHIYIHKTQ